MKILVHIDDVGLTAGFTWAAKILTNLGVVNSLSFRTNGLDFNQAVKYNYKNTVLGLHFNITDGKGRAKQLINSQKQFKYNFINYLFMPPSKQKIVTKHVWYELKTQHLELTKRNVNVVRFDSHDHIHMIPWIFRIACKFCEKQKIPYIRLTDEPWHYSGKILIVPLMKYLLLKFLTIYNKKHLNTCKISSSDAFYGVLNTNNMDKTAILSALNHAQNNKYQNIEILAHPAVTSKNTPPYTSVFISKYSNQTNRTAELTSLASYNIRKKIEYLKKKS